MTAHLHQPELEVAQRYRAAKQAAPALCEPWFAERLCQAALAEDERTDEAGEERSLNVTATTPTHRLFLPVDREQPQPTIGTTWQTKCGVKRYATRGQTSLATAAAGIVKGLHCCSEKKPAARGSTVAQLCGTNHLNDKE